MTNKEESKERSDQDIASEMREKFLRSLSSLAGQSCTINMFGRTTVTAQFQGTNSDLTEFYVKNMITPTGTFEHALLRTDDIIDIEI